MANHKLFNLLLLLQVLNIENKLGSSQVIYYCPAFIQNHVDIFGNNIAIIRVPAQISGVNRIRVEIGIQGLKQYAAGSLQLLRDDRSTIEGIRTYRHILWKLTYPQTMPTPTIRNIYINSHIFCEDSNVYFQTRKIYEDEFNINPYLGRRILVDSETGNDFLSYRSPQFNTEKENYLGRGYIRPFWNENIIPSNKSNPEEPPISEIERIKPTQVAWVKNLSKNCGRRSDATTSEIMGISWYPTVIDGTEIMPGEFPWLVLVKNRRRQKCGASLVSNNFVITAAHCVKGSTNVTLYFGKHDLNKNEEGSKVRTSHKIYIPESYTGGAHADIALVSFIPVEFSNKILPVCIWPFGSNIEAPDGRVVGWGRIRNDDGPDSATPMSAQLTKMDLPICRKNKFATDDTFCAGGANNKAVSCHGDSGGGFYVIRDTTWYLHGIISHSTGTKYKCDALAIFVKIENYLDWLEPFLSS